MSRAFTSTVRRTGVPILALACAAAIAACGGGGHAQPSAKAAKSAVLVDQAFSATGQVNSGHIDIVLDVTLDGVSKLDGKPIVLEISGPFTRTPGGGASADLTVTLTSAVRTLTLGLDAVDGKYYVGYDGSWYRVPGNVHPGHWTGATGASGASGLFATLGINPKSWLTDPHDAGTTTVGGVDTTHFTAQVDLPNLFNDLSKLIAARTGATGATGPTSPVVTGLQAIESAITSAEVDVYTGTADHIVRQVHVAVDFKVPSQAAGLVGGLTGGSLDLTATLTQLNSPQTVTAPSAVQPLSGLQRVLRRLERRLGGGLSIGAGGSFGGILSS
ncbi:MAG: hypothetical protein ACRDLP_04630 [Solirubrobacteraceae bacterium]